MLFSIQYTHRSVHHMNITRKHARVTWNRGPLSLFKRTPAGSMINEIMTVGISISMDKKTVLYVNQSSYILKHVAWIWMAVLWRRSRCLPGSLSFPPFFAHFVSAISIWIWIPRILLLLLWLAIHHSCCRRRSLYAYIPHRMAYHAQCNVIFITTKIE